MTNPFVAPTTNGRAQKTNDAIVYQVYKTTDYFKFTTLPGNRRLNLLHVKRLVESFNQNHLVSPIIVNEHFQVIDGQHRLKASIETGMPVYYIIVPGYSLREIQTYNANQKNWLKMDFLKMYCDLGYKPYLQFRKFMDDFPDFKIQASERILTLCGATGGKSVMIDGIKAKARAFEEGQLEIPDINASYMIARKILDFKPHYAGFNRGTFVSAMLAILKNPNYKHREMVRKLEQCPVKLTDQPNVSAYKMAVEEIYNWRRSQKVSLRYE